MSNTATPTFPIYQHHAADGGERVSSALRTPSQEARIAEWRNAGLDPRTSRPSGAGRDVHVSFNAHLERFATPTLPNPKRVRAIVGPRGHVMLVVQ